MSLKENLHRRIEKLLRPGERIPSDLAALY